MENLPDALAPLAEYEQFILWKVVPRGPKVAKLPVDHRTLRVFEKGDDWQQDPAAWTTAEHALNMAAMCGDDFGVGFFFTPEDPFFFLDIDNCLDATGKDWTPIAHEMLTRLPGGAVEVSQSGTGLHIIAKGVSPPHGMKNTAEGLEFYTERRFVALTGDRAMGSASVDLSVSLPSLVDQYFPPRVRGEAAVEWTTEPDPAWTGTEDDDELVAKAITAKSTAAAFGSDCSFEDLWNADADKLEETYRGDDGGYDASSADAALAQHLAFWTGKNCERMEVLMRKSALVRDKWDDHASYMERTILFAISVQETVYSIVPLDTTLPDLYGACKLKASSDAQRDYADKVRVEKLQACGEDEELAFKIAKIPAAKFFLDNKDLTPQAMIDLITPVEHAADLKRDEAEIVQGYQYLAADQQMEHFKGCHYVQDVHKVFVPSGALLKSEQFNATYGGYSFQLTSDGQKTTRKAYDAFTESQVVRYVQAESTMFRPDLPAGEIAEIDGRTMINTYIPVETPSVPGDVSRFTKHLETLLPVARDREILLAYMAACVQHKGVKFQWAPLIQGAPGNGKTLFTRCVVFAIGRRYSHMPPAKEIAEKFNSFLFENLFIGVEDIYVPEHKQDVMTALLPMITGEWQAKRAMATDQVMTDCCANLMMNCNPKDALRKNQNDRRIAPFFTAQQDKKDIQRDGMGGSYFRDLYAWLRGGGYANVNHFLQTYPLPDELNPANGWTAPETSSTDEAITAGLGGIEQEILEAIEEGRSGFAGGWVSSVAVERLLEGMRATRAIPPNKRRELMQSLGYDWHPALKNGRVNNPLDIDGFKKPRLFIKGGHLSAGLKTANEVVRQYVKCQTEAVNKGGRAFGSSQSNT